jgi:hypothetical protein
MWCVLCDGVVYYSGLTQEQAESIEHTLSCELADPCVYEAVPEAQVA